MGNSVSISTKKSAFRPNESIVVKYDLDDAQYTPGSCWIGLIPSHIKSKEETVNDTHDVSYFHVGHNKVGEGILRTSQWGSYTIKCFANDNGGKFLGSSALIIIGNDTAYLFSIADKHQVAVVYDLSNCNYESGSCWIGLIPKHISNNTEIINDRHDVDYFKVGDNPIGNGKLTTSQAGQYKVKCFANDNGGKYLGCAITTSVNNTITIEDDEKKINENIQQQIQSIKFKPNASRDKIYELAKKVYKKQGKPVIIDTKNALNEIRQNARNYKNVALPLVLGRDKPFNQWNEYQFKREFSTKFNIPIKCIIIKSVRAGSQIIDLKLETHSSGNKLLMPIECLAENISTEQAKKSLVEFGIFAMEFGLPTAGFNCLKQRVIMNPRWNKDYGPNGTNWDGALNDGKSRGNEPYYCPKGWKRFSIQFSETAYDFNNVYDKWPIAYHGTKFHCSMLITLTGLRATGGDHGQGVYLSPSIRYVSHPRYCKPVKFDLSTAQQKGWTSEYVNEFKKYDKKWIQVAFACRVKPGSFVKGKETMRSWLPRHHIKNGKFDNIDINTIEWIVSDSAGTIVESDRILIYGIMIKVSDTETTGY